MNSKSSGIGCSLLILLGLLFYVGQFLFATPVGWAILVGGIAIAIVLASNNKKTKQAKLIQSLEQTAQILEDVAAGKAEEPGVGFNLTKGETFIYALPNVALTEYQSTGSSYSGTTAGVSFPLFGNVRGNVGGQSGQITKNPEQLMIVDQGRAIFTDQRIIFTGAKLVRDWELDKIVELAPGPNGFNVKLAVSNRDRTSGLQALTAYEFGPGFIAAYVFTLHSDGQAKAKAWIQETVKQIRSVLAAEAAKNAKPTPPELEQPK